MLGFTKSLGMLFLSTPSARRATCDGFATQGEAKAFLSTPSARRATCYLAIRALGMRYFYPRPPRGGRREYYTGLDGSGVFLSTPSARRATYNTEAVKRLLLEFLSTPSARRATPYRLRRTKGGRISIHALREEGDSPTPWISARASTFLSTPSARRATYDNVGVLAYRRYFYPRPPRGGRQGLTRLREGA